MTSPRIFRSACRHALGAPRLVITLYLVNLLLAFPALYVTHSALESALGNSLAGESLLPGFDFTVFFDLLGAHSLTPGSLLPLSLSLAVAGVVVQVFLAGGILDLLVREKRFSGATFFRACGAYIGRFTRIWILTVLSLLLVIALFCILFVAMVDIINAKMGSEQATGIATIIVLVVFSVPVLLVFMASDYARVNTVVHEGQSAWMSLRRGFLFVLRNIGSTLGLHLLLLLLLTVFIVLYLSLEGLINMDRSFTILLVFLLQQLFVLARLAIRVAFCAGEVELYEERKPRPVVFYGWDDSPPIQAH